MWRYGAERDFTKNPKNMRFWLFNRLFYSGRNGDIWPKIGHLGAKEAQKTIEHQKIVFRAHFEKIEKKSSFLLKKCTKKIFKVDFHRPILPGQQIDIARRYILSGPPKTLYCGLYHQLPTTFPHMLNFRGEISKVHFFRFFPLKWST